jgi:hypothetical protein
MDPIDRWSQQRLLEEVATSDSRGDKPASRGGRNVGAALLVIIIFILAALVALASRDTGEPASAPGSAAGAGALTETVDVVG